MRKEKNRYREAHRAVRDVERRGPRQAGCGGVTPSARRERAWEWAGGPMAFPGRCAAASSGCIEHRVYCFRLSWTRFLLSMGFMAFTANECLFLNYKNPHLSTIPRCPPRTLAS